MKISIPLTKQITDVIEERNTGKSVSKSTTSDHVEKLLIDEIQKRQRELKPGIWKKA